MKQQGLTNDKMKSMSSADFQPKPDPSQTSIKQSMPVAAPSAQTTAQAFGYQEMEVKQLGGNSTGQDRPKKGMQLGKGNASKKLPNDIEI